MSLRSVLAPLLVLFLPACGGAAEPVEIATLAEIEAAVAAERGHPLLVNFWATWCPPCVAELPALAAAAPAFEARGGRVLLVSFDLVTPNAKRGETLDEVRAFLRQRELPFRTLVCDPADFERTDERFALEGVVPVTLVYDAEGELVERHFGEASRERFTELMEKALAPAGER